MKTLFAAAASLALIAAPLAASAQTWSHGGERHGGWDHHNYGGQHYGHGDYGRGYGYGGAALAAGAFGYVLGSSLYSQPYAYDQGYGYSEPYGYDGEYGGYEERCSWRNRPFRDAYGRIEYRQIQVCR